jgi:hypothetical protein
MTKMTLTSEHHDDPGEVRRLNYLCVAHRTPRLDDRRDAGVGE